MCGIAGIFHPGTPKPVEPNRILAMIAAQTHRGPDGDGIWTAPGVGLGHRRLSIIDLSADGAQPMGVTCARCGVGHHTPADDALWLAYNGEVYNFPALRSELEAAGHQFRSRTDSEVLLHLYAERGPAMLERLTSKKGRNA